MIASVPRLLRRNAARQPIARHVNPRYHLIGSSDGIRIALSSFRKWENTTPADEKALPRLIPISDRFESSQTPSAPFDNGTPLRRIQIDLEAV
jgi:hypothetical protein